MPKHSWIVGCVAGLIVATVASNARADGFFVTFTNTNGSAVAPRVAGAVFDASSAAPVDLATGLPSGQTLNKAVHVEIDDLGKDMVPLLVALVADRKLNVSVEFTTPDAQGQEQVYMVGTFSGVSLASWSANLDTRSTAPLQHLIDFTAPNATYGAPPAIRTKPPLRAVTREAPTIRRMAGARQRPASHVEDAYLQIASISGESADHPGQTRVLSVSFGYVRPRDPATGAATGALIVKPLVLVKANGAANAALQNAVTQHTNLNPVTISFNQHHAGAADSALFGLVMNNVMVSSNTIQVGGPANGETVSFVYQRAVLTDNATNAIATVDRP